MDKVSLDERIGTLLKNLSYENLKNLFWQELNYDRRNEVLQIPEPSSAVTKDLKDNPILFATAADNDEFHIIYLRFNQAKLHLTSERAIINKLTKNHPYCLYVFSNHEQNLWHFVNSKLPENEKDTDNPIKRKLIRRIVIGKDENLKTAISRIAMLEISSDKDDLFNKQSALSIQKQHDDAFDVDKVTKQFYEGYKAVFDILWKDLIKQSNDTKWAHDYALQFLNRLMFLYFIQRKRWMDNDPEWITGFFNAYRKANLTKDRFISDWLNDLFFYAFNNKKIFDPKRNYPPEILNALNNAPYLNGGLFEENNLDIAYKFKFVISDNRFKQILDFLNSYNFTVREDSPLDQEVAVDAEMLGKVYESLVNVSTEIDERGEAGIFYTQRIEIDLMSRLSIVDNLANNLGNEYKNLFYEFVFAMDSYEKADADRQITEKGLWDKIHSHLKSIAIVDPACGSGAFLVGMLLVIDDLTERAEQGLHSIDKSFPISSSYERRKQIICNSLFGVDVMQWAVEIAELRLWLQLVIETDIPQFELQNVPLLPKLSFKIRRGDSLVQPVPSIFDLVRSLGLTLSSGFTKLRTTLEQKKAKFFNNELSVTQAEMLEREETEIYLKGYEELVQYYRERIFYKKASLDDTFTTSLGEKEYTLSVEQRNKLQKEIEYDQAKLAEYTKYLDFLLRNENFFAWDKDFSEVFQKGKEGFDIVIGNPPYVRQEKIADPLSNEDKPSIKNKQLYKSKLAKQVHSKFPNFLKDMPIASNSDLYIYFYFKGLALINKNGSFCFITSSSWLDVGYGACLQEFLLKHTRIKYIIDNQFKRSFSASVNTTIVLLSCLWPSDNYGNWEKQIAKFVNFTKPYEEVLSPIIFSEIDEISDRGTTNEYRILNMKHIDMYIAGSTSISYNKTSNDCIKKGPTTQEYYGDKWGGKYLRASDFYWRVIEDSSSLMVYSSNLISVRFGLKTGADKFFLINDLTEKTWGIEPEYLVPILKTAKDSVSIFVDKSTLKTKLFFCNVTKDKLIGTNALRYITWGEEQGYNAVPSVSGRRNWYSVGNKPYADCIIPRRIGERYIVFEGNKLLENCVLFGITRKNPRVELDLLLGLMNSTLTRLIIETLSSQLTGAQTVSDTNVYIIERILLPNPELIDNYDKQEIINTMRDMKHRPIQPFKEEMFKPDRIKLDTLILNVLGFDKKDIDDLYKAMADLINSRIEKSESLKKRDI